MKPRLLVQRLVALFAAGLLLFDFPLIGLFRGSATAVFVAWGLVIALVAFLMERADDGS
jgi:hypothetical protein